MTDISIEAQENELAKLYAAAKRIQPSVAMRLAQQAKTQEERFFYARIAEMNLQRRQKETIEKNLF